MADAKHTPALAPQTARLQRVMAAAGWEIQFVDLDLTGVHPRVDMRVMRDDGRWIHARVDALGRATVERFQRQRWLGMSADTKGRRPLSPQVADEFLGREHCTGARAMLRGLTAYLTDNASRPVVLADMRAAWASVMAAPLVIESAVKATGSVGHG